MGVVATLAGSSAVTVLGVSTATRDPVRSSSLVNHRPAISDGVETVPASHRPCSLTACTVLPGVTVDLGQAAPAGHPVSAVPMTSRRTEVLGIVAARASASAGEKIG